MQKEVIINDELKNVAQIVHSRHRSVFNFVMNVLSVQGAYSCFEKKPSIIIGYCIENVDGQLAVIKQTLFGLINSALCHPYYLEGKCNMHLSEIWHSKKNDCCLSRTQVMSRDYMSCYAHRGNSVGVAFPQPWVEVRSASTQGITPLPKQLYRSCDQPKAFVLP